MLFIWTTKTPLGFDGVQCNDGVGQSGKDGELPRDAKFTGPLRSWKLSMQVDGIESFYSVVFSDETQLAIVQGSNTIA